MIYMKEIKQAINRFQREIIFLALSLILIGVLFIAFPESSARIICYAMGIVACIWGLIRLVAHFKVDSMEVFGSYGLVQGATLLIIGIAIIAKPDVLAKFVTMAFGIIMLIDGVLKIQYAIDLGRIKAGGWIWVMVTAVLMIVLGVIAIVNPFETNAVLMVFLGCILIADGISDLVVIGYIVRTVKTIKRAVTKNQRSVIDGYAEDLDDDY